MSFSFDTGDFGDFFIEPQNSEITIVSDTIKLNTPKGDILYQEKEIRSNLSILSGEYNMIEDALIYGKGNNYLLEMHFNMSSQEIFYQNRAVNRESVPAMSGNITYLSPEDNKAKIAFNKNEIYHTFDIHLPLEMLINYSGESFAMDNFLKNINMNLSTVFSKENIKINSNLSKAIQNIKYCPYKGLTEKIYLESKVYEILSLVHDGVSQTNSVNQKFKIDRDQIEYAAYLIQQNLDNPFTIIGLSRKLGINQTKLKSDFKEVFGSTIFGYLQELRMARARQLLLDTNLSVQQISISCGYKNLSNFSNAFKMIYGYSPTKLRGIA